MSDTPFKIVAIGVGIKLKENPRLLPHLTAAAPTRRELTHAIGNEIFDGDDAEAGILSIGLNQPEPRGIRCATHRRAGDHLEAKAEIRVNPTLEQLARA